MWFDLNCFNRLSVYNITCRFLERIKCAIFFMVMAKQKTKTKKTFDCVFFSCCNLSLKFKKITSGYTLAERRKAWSVTSKAEFSSETPALILYICFFHFLVKYCSELWISYVNWTDMNKLDRTLTTKVCFWRHGPENNIKVVTSLLSLGKGESGSDCSKL